MIYVQHLLGIGHLRRIWFLACALADNNIQVDLVTGGMPVSDLAYKNIRVHQLPPVRSRDGRFDQLVNELGEDIDEAWKDNRRDRLLELFDRIQPRMLITETFPFGRRMMRFELVPLLQAAKQSANPAIIVSSIRDILQPKSKHGRNEEVLKWLRSYYDHILIHGDQNIARLDLTFPLTEQIAGKLTYTGYITNPSSDHSDTQDGVDEVVVSGGGGAASLNLLKAAIAAKPLCDLKHHQWRILVGNNLDQGSFEQLQQAASEGIIVERNRADFPALLKRCTVSVSQAGYNTVMDILRQQTAAVLVPFAEAGEVEQSLRAQQLQKRDRVVCFDEDSLTAEMLAQAIDQACNMKVENFEINMDGATNSAKWIMDRLNG